MFLVVYIFNKFMNLTNWKNRLKNTYFNKCMSPLRCAWCATYTLLVWSNCKRFRQFCKIFAWIFVLLFRTLCNFSSDFFTLHFVILSKFTTSHSKAKFVAIIKAIFFGWFIKSLYVGVGRLSWSSGLRTPMRCECVCTHIRISKLHF